MAYYQRFTQLFITISTILLSTVACSDQERITLFPLDNYDQTITNWIKPSSPDYNKPILEPAMQQTRLQIFKEHYFGNQSPWNGAYVNQIIRQGSPDDIKSLEQSIITGFDNNDKPANQIGYSENFRPYDELWIKEIEENINLSQFDAINFQAENRAIAVINLNARALPTDEPHFYSHKLAGQGYPFDNLQASAVWAGTPLYILGETKDKAWSLVLTPEFIAWVRSEGVARTDAQFVNQWVSAANINLAAITKTKTPITYENQHLFFAYVGSVFPAEQTASGIKLMIPVKVSGKATNVPLVVSQENAALMPVPFTSKNISLVMQSLIGRPYGWGSMYFYNDCSAELKSLLTPFAIWLPRHSSHQVTQGKIVDLAANTSEQRLAYLREHGRPFVTLVYIGGHVFLYLGNYQNPKTQQINVLSFQDIWGLRPASNASRAVIGKSVLFPILQSYPEDTSLMPLTSRPAFQVSFLDELPAPSIPDMRLMVRKLMMVDEF